MSYDGAKCELPLGEYGLLTDIAPDKQPPNSLIRSTNVSFFNGCVEKAPGTVRWNATPLPAGIVAVHHWRPTLVRDRYIAITETGNIYKGQDRQFGSAINTSIASTLTPNCKFAPGGAETAGRDKKLFLFTGGATNPFVLAGDGTAFTTMSRPSVDWTGTNFPKFGVVHRGRLWAFAGQLSYASDTADHENFLTAALTEPVYPGEGGELVGGYVYKTRLFAFKDGGFTYMLNDADTDEVNWYWQKVASNFDLAAPNAIAEVLDDLLAGNTSGTISSYSATQKLGDVEAADVIQMAMFESFLRGNVSKVGVEFQHLLYYGEKKQLFQTYRSYYNTHNDMLVMLDYGRTPVRASFWIKGSPQCLASYTDVNKVKRPMYGDKDGYLHLMDREDRSEGGTAYTGEFQIPHIDFSHLGQGMKSAQKNFDFLAVHYLPESSGNLSCDYYVDGRYIDTLTFVMVQNKRPELDTLVLGTDRLASPTTETALQKLACTGRTFSARFYQAGSNQSFKIAAITVMFRGGGDEAQKT